MIYLFLPEGKIGKYRRLPSPINSGGSVLHLVYESSKPNNRMQPDFGNRYAIASAADAGRYVALKIGI